MSFIFVNIHICMLIFTPQFDVFFIYYAHAYLFTLVLFVYLLLKRAPRKIGYQPIGLPSQNKEFTYLLQSDQDLRCQLPEFWRAPVA